MKARRKRISAPRKRVSATKLNLAQSWQNATRYTRCGFVEVCVRVDCDDDVATTGMVSVEFIVRDSGKGVSAAEQTSIFDRYVSSGGIGLGMHLVELQTRQMGSKVHVRSPWTSEHAGTEFRYVLRLKQLGVPAPDGIATADAHPHDDAGTADCSRGGTTNNDAVSHANASANVNANTNTNTNTNSGSIGSRLRVLVADDMAVNRRLLCRSFRMVWPHWTIDEAELAEVALEKAAHIAYDLIVIDEKFGPDCIPGSAAIRQMRGDERTAAVALGNPVIISCTGNAESEAANLKACGADDVWTKPFPTFRDGSLQRCLTRHFARVRMPLG